MPGRIKVIGIGNRPGVDIQHYLGHRSIASTVRYTALAPDRFKHFWKD
jgi:site-specific recombinase XerD